MSRLTSDGFDDDRAVHELRHFQLEHAPNEVRVAATHDDLRPSRLVAHLDDDRLHAIASIEPLVGDALGARHDRLGVTEIENHIPAIDLLDNPGDEITLPAGIQLEDLAALGVSQALGDDLLGRLGSDAAEVIRRIFPLAEDVAVFIELLGIHGDVTGFRVDGDPCLLGGAGIPLVGGHEGVGEGVEDRFDRHPPLALEQLERIHDLSIDSHAVSCRDPGLAPRSQTNTVLADRTSA